MGWLLLIIAAWWSDGEGWKRRRSETLRSQPGGRNRTAVNTSLHPVVVTASVVSAYSHLQRERSVNWITKTMAITCPFALTRHVEHWLEA
jgi:hypothetical protein